MKLVIELEKSSLDQVFEHKITLVLIDDAEYAEELGLDKPPTLIHFSNDVPSVYYGEENPDLIMDWLIRLKSEPVIEEVTSEINDTIHIVTSQTQKAVLEDLIVRCPLTAEERSSLVTALSQCGFIQEENPVEI